MTHMANIDISTDTPAPQPATAINVECDAVSVDDSDNPDAKCNVILHDLRCSAKGHIVNVSLEALDVNDRGNTFFVPCPICGSPVYIIDADIAKAYDISKDEVKAMRSRMANEKHQKPATELLMHGERPDYNPQDADRHGRVEQHSVPIDDDLVGSIDILEPGNGNESVYIKQRPIVVVDDNDNGNDNGKNTGNDNSAKTTHGDGMNVSMYDDDEKDFEIPVRSKHVIAPKNDPTVATPPATNPSVVSDDDDGENPSGDMDIDRELEPNELLKTIIRESKLDKKIKHHICEDIDLEPNGWQPLAVSALLQSYTIPQATANKIAKLYEALLTKENRKRQLRETRSQMLGRPSGNFNLFNNEYQNPGLFGTMGLNPGLNQGIMGTMMPGISAPLNTSSLAQQVAGLMGTSQSNPAMGALLTQLYQIIQQITSLQTPNAPVGVQQGLTQVYPLVTTMVNYIDSLNKMGHVMTPQDSMMLMQSMTQIQQTLVNLNRQMQEEQRVPTRPRTTDRFDYDRFDVDRTDRADRMARLAALRRRRLLDDDDDDDDVFASRRKKTDAPEQRDVVAQMMQMFMMQQQMQQMQQQTNAPQTPSPIEAELKQMRELVMAMMNEKKDREKEESLQEIREMKELMYNLIQQQSAPRNPAQDTTQLLLEFLKIQQQQQSVSSSDKNDGVIPIILEMIRSQSGNTHNDDLKELRQFMLEVIKQNSQKDHDSKPDPRDVQQQELFNKLLGYALDGNKNNQYDQILTMLVNEIRDLKRTGVGGGAVVPPAPLSVDEMRYNLETEKFRSEMDLKKRELEEKRENRNFIKEMIDNSFRQIGESVGALLTSGALNSLGGAPGVTYPTQQQIQPYVNDDGNVMAFQCQHCGNAIYAPYGAHSVSCPYCQYHYVLSSVPTKPSVPVEQVSMPETMQSTPNQYTPATAYEEADEPEYSSNVWDFSAPWSQPAPAPAPAQVNVETSPVVDRTDVPIAANAQPPVYETRPVNPNVTVRKVSDLPPVIPDIDGNLPVDSSESTPSASEVPVTPKPKSKSKPKSKTPKTPKTPKVTEASASVKQKDGGEKDAGSSVSAGSEGVSAQVVSVDGNSTVDAL